MFFLAKFASAQRGPKGPAESRRRGRGGVRPPYHANTMTARAPGRAAWPKKAPADSKNPVDIALALCYYGIDSTHKEVDRRASQRSEQALGCLLHDLQSSY